LTGKTNGKQRKGTLDERPFYDYVSDMNQSFLGRETGPAGAAVIVSDALGIDVMPPPLTRIGWPISKSPMSHRGVA
jgi:hypothetical protein